MADSTIQLPYTGTTSGDLLDASLLGAVKRERMVLSNDASTSVAVVTSSGTLLVSGLVALSSGTITLSSAPTVNVSSGIITLSSNPVAGQIVSLSSGTVTLSSAPTVNISSGIITLSSNPVAGQVVSLSSGLVTLSSNPVAGQIISLSSGTVTLSSVIGISSGLVTLSSNPVAGQIISLSSGTVTLSSVIGISSGLVTQSSNPVAGQIVSLSSGTVTLSSSPTVLTTGTYLVNATSTSGLLVDVSRGVSLAFFNFTATSSGLKSLVAASGSNKVKLISYVVVSNSTQEVGFYSSNTPLGGSSSAPMVLSSYSGISAVGDRTSWLMETSAAGNLQIYLGNSGIIAGHGSYVYEV